MLIRRITSSLVIFLILLSGTHFSMASHTCGGSLAAIRLSFDGALAGCGMEQDHLPPSKTPVLESDCCHDQLSRIGTDETISTDIQILQELPSLSSVFLCTLDLFHLHPLITLDPSSTNSGPPGILDSSSVDLDRICISRC